MNSALLHNGKVITAREYHATEHGTRISCIDKGCNVPVIFVPASESVGPHFKTTGKGDSKHHSTCGFYKPLSFIESAKKIEEYQEDFLDRGIQENVLRINLSKIDPDYQEKERETTEREKKITDPNEVKVKQDNNNTPKSISSLKSIVKLLSSYEPDVLSSILVNIRGKKIPISSIIVDQVKAHEILWTDKIVDQIGYFVYGTVENVLRREKVWYINYKIVDNTMFSLVLFDKYFKHFSYSDEQLVGKTILAWGQLKKNTFNDKNTTEMSIKSDRYIEFLK
ncbi:hypothetical protein [Bacillus alkalicellulosilyticus]|uniref:hypothetical protein n=1 Tax=Alkalihalobacterium alkalicellulosilyticum TaxID=1912214 RepID=UPI0009979147|nr:hypothetical protein [Bacillus alkalicellulosilyticus]